MARPGKGIRVMPSDTIVPAEHNNAPESDIACKHHQLLFNKFKMEEYSAG